MIEFSITDEPILIANCEKNFIANEAGAFASFAGRVRNQNEGKSVLALEYEVFIELASNEGHKILQEAQSLFGTIRARAMHRQGKLQLGECAVWIGVLSQHRTEAFTACRYIIDEIKTRLPIWKKEHYEKHPIEWVSCQHQVPQISSQIYYSKQKRLIGNLGQERLQASRVLIVGIGGLGCPAATALVSAGIGSLSLCDGDRLELSNLHRQSLFDYHNLGEYKAELATKRLKQLNPFCQIKSICEHISPHNVESLLAEHDLVLDCSDNFKTKILLHDHCVRLNKALVQASIHSGTGLIQAFANFENGCMRCVWPENFVDGDFKTCREAGVLGAQTGSLGSMQALQALNILLGQNTEILEFAFYIDLNDFSIHKVRRQRDKNCSFHTNVNRQKTLPNTRIINSTSDSRIVIDLQAEDLTTEDLVQLSLHNPNHDIILKCPKGLQSRLLVAELHRRGFTKIKTYQDNPLC